VKLREVPAASQRSVRSATAAAALVYQRQRGTNPWANLCQRRSPAALGPGVVSNGRSTNMSTAPALWSRRNRRGIAP